LEEIEKHIFSIVLIQNKHIRYQFAKIAIFFKSAAKKVPLASRLPAISEIFPDFVQFCAEPARFFINFEGLGKIAIL
jgi:hypothetical protein